MPWLELISHSLAGRPLTKAIRGDVFAQLLSPAVASNQSLTELEYVSLSFFIIL